MNFCNFKGDIYIILCIYIYKYVMYTLVRVQNPVGRHQIHQNTRND